MKIIRSTEKEGCKSLVKIEKKESKNEKENKVAKILSYLGENRRRAIVVACSVFLIAGAIFLNWRLFGVNAQENENGGPSSAQTQEPDNSVSGNADENEAYFALAVIERQRARDEALAVLQNIVDSSDVSDEDKTGALDSISQIADNINSEANIQTLLRSKGFEDCVAVVEDGKASIVIGTSETLNPAQIAQITEIVYRVAGIPPLNVIINEKKI